MAANELTTRSWYLPKDVADELSSACDDLYYDLRGVVPKHRILAELIREGVKHQGKVRQKLTPRAK